MKRQREREIEMENGLENKAGAELKSYTAITSRFIC